jgi:acetolactate synthase-1/2/3 large subunit
MAFALPGALGVRLAEPDRKVLAVMGDGAFLMNSQEIETAVREQIPLVDSSVHLRVYPQLPKTFRGGQ